MPQETHLGQWRSFAAFFFAVYDSMLVDRCAICCRSLLRGQSKSVCSPTDGMRGDVSKILQEGSLVDSRVSFFSWEYHYWCSQCIRSYFSGTEVLFLDSTQRVSPTSGYLDCWRGFQHGWILWRQIRSDGGRLFNKEMVEWDGLLLHAGPLDARRWMTFPTRLIVYNSHQ